MMYFVDMNNRTKKSKAAVLITLDSGRKFEFTKREAKELKGILKFLDKVDIVAPKFEGYLANLKK